MNFRRFIPDFKSRPPEEETVKPKPEISQPVSFVQQSAEKKNSTEKHDLLKAEAKRLLSELSIFINHYTPGQSVSEKFRSDFMKWKEEARGSAYMTSNSALQNAALLDSMSFPSLADADLAIRTIWGKEEPLSFQDTERFIVNAKGADLIKAIRYEKKAKNAKFRLYDAFLDVRAVLKDYT